ncbi:MAG: isoleucine--tRNA ligase [Reyranella sp.]|uniref:isoleucine--tRNA ligase n=1 Tax=Reyranella sp. TaxID=1929291 RepID=UPI001206149F|nr:isoleucine--tRNA ligase [Reyranella sp.]TAJ85153.1 MAG: isoleucine--tRNA ligase [Reyranella sp.]
MTTDYKTSVFLPKTDFPMRGGLPKKEPELLKRWADMKLWDRIREESKGRPKFVLHDGPPYANGHLHIGHALNKILKDLVSRTQQMLGKDSHYVPGWDCHGLPIEWKIEEQYRAKKQDKDQVPIVEFRRECRAFADHWITVQREEFKRLGVDGDWDNYYSTMKYESEAVIVKELGKFLLNGGLYKGSKAVLWSVVEKTALAEAEIEYHDHTSDTIHVRFPVVQSKGGKLDGTSIVIWTTTPWTMPGNRALAYGKDIAYVLVEVAAVAEGSKARVGERLVLARDLVDAVAEEAKFTPKVVAEVPSDELEGLIAAHPLRGQGFEFDVRLLAGDFVTADAGTGFVHIAPGHGADDYELGVANGVEVPDTVAEDGSYYPHVPLFAGKRVYTPEGKKGDANRTAIALLDEAGKLLASGRITHSYPHSWRSKAPVIFRNAPQWFIAMDKPIPEIGGTLREKALAAIDATRFVPRAGYNRLRSMIETRPDWNVSRQRAWGVPIAVFVDKKTGEPLRDAEVMGRVVEAFRTEGADAWFGSPPERFLGNKYDAADFEQVTDILDVWFDSGCTHAFTLEGNERLKWPADLYLEGSDQHRGWFHSSLLESCGTRGRAPYDGVLTHGFTLDEQGRKMSKSLGNITAPQTVCDQYGADILRLWVVGTDYTEDQRIGPEILKHQAEAYRRLRNTLRYLLGSLEGYSSDETVAHADMPELERWVLHRLAELDAVMRRAVDDYDFHAIATELHNFCAVDLSAFYFDIRKDSIYCDAAGTLRRRAARTVMAEVYSFLTAWLAPITCFTAEEAWLARPGDMPDGKAESVHLRLYPTIPPAWLDAALGEKWKTVRALRRVVTGALELERAEKRIGSSLQAAPVVYAAPEYLKAFEGLDLRDYCITSGGSLVAGEAPAGAFTLPDVAGVAVVPALADGTKCARCWQVLEEVGKSAAHPLLCRRCEEAVSV